MTWIIILQLGTPERLDNKSIRAYLKEFLMDPRVLSMPFFIRYILVNWIIVPRRTKKVSKRYELIWDREKGSPLKYYGDSLVNKLKKRAPGEVEIFHAMRYGSASIKTILEKANQDNPDKIIFVPLFPQETEATTGSIRAEVARVISGFRIKPETVWLPVFEKDQAYQEIMASRLIESGWQSYDKTVFTFHGLPLKHIEADHKGLTCDDLGCADIDSSSDYNCYTRSCYKTASEIAKKAGLSENHYSVSFQSRFGKNWIGPQTEDILLDMAKKGKSVLVMAPSFLTDCLETSWEIGISFRQEFQNAGGKKFSWIPALNDDNDWTELLAKRLEL